MKKQQKVVVACSTFIMGLSLLVRPASAGTLPPGCGEGGSFGLCVSVNQSSLCEEIGAACQYEYDYVCGSGGLTYAGGSGGCGEETECWDPWQETTFQGYPVDCPMH